MNEPLATQLATWVSRVSFDDLPVDVIKATKLRIMDVIGLAFAGLATDFGRSVRAGALAISPAGPCRILGSGDNVGLTAAAFANGALPQALEFDDTHIESIVHMSSPAVAAALAISETRPTTGRDLIAAIAVSNEVSCRVGSVSSGEFHRRGFHPTGLFTPFGVTYMTGRMLGLDRDTLASAAGICGSFAAGLLECWVDGTQTKFLHSGWAAQSGITAALLAQAGTSGPARVFEGRFGLFASHLQDAAASKNFDRIAGQLGTRWESRDSSFKPYPAAHVLHPYITAALRLRQRHALVAADIAQVECPVTAFIVPIVCEPVEEKFTPASQAHGRVSLQYTLAEALYYGELGRTAYEDWRRTPDVLALARRVRYYVDPAFPGPGRFKGAVRVTTSDGRTFSDVEEYNLGSPENPMSDAQLRAKFDENTAESLSADERDRLVGAINRTEELSDASQLVTLSTPAVGASFRRP